MSDGEQKGPTKSIEDLLKLLSMGEKLSDSQEKQMQDYKFWKTQPVRSFDEKVTLEGPVDPNTDTENVPNDPFPILKEFEWCLIDLDNKTELDELYTLLYENYVEDKDAIFRLKYSPEFFKFALKPPGWRADWYVGVRVKETGKLVAFISSIPATVRLNENIIPTVEINFLCIHKKLRSKRLAPVLIKEITRRVHKQNIWQGLHTGGVLLPSPIATCRYTHRPINWSKLYDVGFSHLPYNKTKAAMVAHYALPNTTKLEGLRLMEHKDLKQVYDLLENYQKRFKLAQVFEMKELEHWLLGGSEDEEKSQVIKSYVVEKDGKITDFVSYYLLPCSVLDNGLHNEVSIAFLFYYATDSAGTDGYKQRLNYLINDALITSKQYGVDVFNCLTTQDNPYFIKEAKFGPGDGLLNYYLFNYRTFPLSGGIDSKTQEIVEDESTDIGLVLF